jgi:glyoxylase-like metal-dependent hydrolase (beta-lactamase superfamily II)
MRHLRVGDVTVTSIIERDGPWRTPAAMFPTWDPERGAEHIAALEPEMFDHASGRMVMTYQTFVVRTPRHTILVDTCTGEDKQLPPPLDFDRQPWRAGFDALGLRFSDIDYVFCTHLHFDHTGWNTQLVDGRWTPTFPNATYIFHRREYEAWEKAVLDPSDPQARIFAMNCEPVVAAGQALLVDDDFALDDTITLIPTPGHSPAHCCVEISSRGQRAVVTGDLIHHALQVLDPSLHTIFCWSPAQAVASRRRWLGQVVGSDVDVVPVHFPHPVVGRIVADGDAFAFRYRRGGA